ncbi:MAG: radical SAM protein [Candidatus Omnitrophica bacterium]|nr:radical SAM protein [Candidatus Omnitrophota bacterium]
MYRFDNHIAAYDESRRYNRKGEIAAFPPYVTFELGNSCNFSCIMCRKTYIKEKKEELDFSVFKKCVDEISNYGSLVRFIGYCEPLLYSKIKDAIRYVKKKGLRLHITTNGSLLNREMINAILENEVDSVIFSFQGFTQEEDCFMRNISCKTYSNVVNKIKLLHKSRKSEKPYITISTTITSRDNPEYETEFIKRHMCYADQVQVTGATHFAFIEDESGIRDIEKKLGLNKPRKLKNVKCFLTNYEMKIAENGNVYMCCGSFTDELNIGNIEKNTLFNMWHSEKAMKIRETLAFGDLDKFKNCRACQIRYDYDKIGNTIMNTMKGKNKKKKMELYAEER